MRPILTALILFLGPTAWCATTWYVPDNFATIQGAISNPLVVSGDTVIVRANTYQENLDFLGKGITLKSEKGPWWTTIDGQLGGSVVTFASGEGPTSVLDGFTLKYGSGTDINPPGLINCGGGILCRSASPVIINNIITENQVSYYGGGMYCDLGAAPLIDSNLIIENWSMDDGAGLAIWFCQAGAAPTVRSNRIEMNFAVGSGGGVDCWESFPDLINNLIVRNLAGATGLSATGGGIRCHNSAPIITNNTICDNVANGAMGSGGGLYSVISPLVTNTIIWDNQAALSPEVFGPAQVSYSDIQLPFGVYPGPGNINSQPLFAGKPTADYHLTALSPCVDAGDNFAPLLPATDFEADPRRYDVPSVPDTGLGAPPLVDLGADEFHTHLYITGNAVAGGTISLNFVGWPGTTPLALALSLSKLTTPLLTGRGYWYLQAPLFILMPLPAIPANGVSSLSLMISPTAPVPFTVYLQALIGTRFSNLSVLEAR